MRCKALVFLVLVGTWQVVALAVGDDRVLPSPVYVATVSFPAIAVFDGTQGWEAALLVVLRHSALTVARIIVALPFGIVIGMGLALLVHFFQAFSGGSAVVLRAIQSVPLFALIPLFLQWFGGRELGVIVYIIVAVSVIAAGAAYNAVSNIKPEYLFQARLSGATRLRMFITVHLAAIRPEMIASLRTILGFCWAFSLGAEYLTSDSGLGFLVYQSYLYADMGKLIFFIVLYGAYGLALQVISRPLLGRLRRGIVPNERSFPDIAASSRQG